MKGKILDRFKLGEGELQFIDNKNNMYSIVFVIDETNHNILSSTMKNTLKSYFDSIFITDQREDAVQFCFSQDEDFWLYFEYNYPNKELHEMVVNLRKYSKEERLHNVQGFYKSLEEVYELYGDDSNQIIAECIFENSIV